MDTDTRLDEFRRWLEIKGRSLNTIHSYLSDARQFLNWAPETVTPLNLEALIVDWLREPASNATINRRMASMRVFSRAVYSLDVLMDHAPTRPATGYAHPLPDGQIDLRKMLEVAKPHHQALIVLCGYGGARVTEARQVHGLDVFQDDAENWWVYLKGKGRADRRVPLPEWTIPYLHLDESHGGLLVKLSDRGARYAITATARTAGVRRDVASHDLRMTAGTELYGHTQNLRLVQDFLGHESAKTTERYTGIREKQMVEAVQGVFS